MLFRMCVCGWHSEGYPDDTIFMGLGGQLSCPECTTEKRNQNIEVYGNVEVVNQDEFFMIWFAADMETTFKKVQNEHFDQERKQVEEYRKLQELEEKALSKKKSIRIVSKYKGRGKYNP